MIERERFGPIECAPLPPRSDDRADSFTELARPDVGTYSSLRAYCEVLSKHRWEVLAALLLVLSIVAIYSFKMKPVYRATVRLEIEAGASQIQSLNDLDRYIPTDESFLRTQVKVLESENLAWQTIQQLGLAEIPEFASQLGNGKGPASDDRVKRDLLIGEFSSRRTVRLAPNSRILDISFESTDPDLAARVVNTLVNDYIEYNFHKKYDATRKASGWMEQQLDELKAKVERSQQSLVDYERRNAIVDISDKENVVEQRLADLSKDLTNAESDCRQKQSLYELVKSNDASVAFLAQNELLQRLEEKYADLKSQYVDALGQYGPNFPKVGRLRDQVNEIQSLIDREHKRVVARIGNDYMAALGRQRLVADAVAREKVEVGKLDQLLIQHNILKREFETNQQLYESLLQRLKDATVSAGLRATNVHVVDTALPPAVPARPQKLLYMALGLLVGLFIGIALAFLQEGLDDSIKTAEDVERLIDTPSLAIIPAASSAGARQYRLKSRNAKGAPNGEVALAVLREPASHLAESYRALRTSVLFSTAPRPPQTLLVTSTQPNEGKTCTSLNLGLTLAQRGGRVLVMDSDLRKPGIASAFGLITNKGLSGVLTGAYSLDAALHQVETIPNMWVLPAGPHPPNPAELLSSSSMEGILWELRQRFDHVVLDSPPLLLVTDATILSTLVDGVILVVESGVTARDALVHSHRILKSAGGRILGVVMNKVDLRLNGYYGCYYSGYLHYGESSSVGASQAEERRLSA